MLKAWLRPWQVGRRGAAPSSLPPQLGWKSSDRPPLSESHCSWWWWQSLSVSIRRAISIHHSLVFWPPSPLLPSARSRPSLSLTHSSNFSSPLFSRLLAQEVCVKRLYLCGAVGRIKKQEGECEKLPPWFLLSLTFCCSMRCEVWDSLSTFLTPLRRLASIFFWIQSSSLSHFLYLALCPPPFASQAVWHLALSLWRGTVDADNYTSCPVSAL